MTEFAVKAATGVALVCAALTGLYFKIEWSGAILLIGIAIILGAS